MTTYKTILETIKKYETIIIHRHMKPDPDAIGSQVGLKRLLQHNFPEKKVLATGFNEPTLEWLAKMDTVLDDDYKNALVIVTDTANTPRIDDKRYSKGNFLIKMDHHPNDDPYGNLYLVDTNASSASEIIADFAYQMQLELTSDAARLLYAGIVGDTGRFLYPATSSKTLKIASQLRQFDFDFSEVSRQMDSFPYKIAKLQGFVYDHLEIDENGVARVFLTKEIMDKFQVSDAETAAIVSAPGKIDSIVTWAIFVEQADGHYRVRLRSKTVVINGIAKNHDGGGHPLASGANSYSDEENDAIYQELRDAVKQEKNSN
ncbi:DHH family phosphoesterase [Streptococcus pacificus]|uniref:Bifunctional oligoribonuclease/PAP phosphatase NrnA n=1 Tax=Streptococcus pacificus TaxID=2740577 RepID=A0ABS0ZIZ1_9STRE|nr:bifunctional oligoribonuclease/PAP phosphatase NrnA [Streptococcus pacificus]MBJ8325985.1 bifunctional oligoribonuclease/PAP phosphatase NrnA [Streptococcus pacificus]